MFETNSRGVWVKNAAEEDVRQKAQTILDRGGVTFVSMTPSEQTNTIVWDFDVLSTSGNRYSPYGDSAFSDPTRFVGKDSTNCTCEWGRWNVPPRDPNYDHLTPMMCAHRMACELWLYENGQARLDEWTAQQQAVQQPQQPPPVDPNQQQDPAAQQTNDPNQNQPQQTTEVPGPPPPQEEPMLRPRARLVTRGVWEHEIDAAVDNVVHGVVRKIATESNTTIYRGLSVELPENIQRLLQGAETDEEYEQYQNLGHMIVGHLEQNVRPYDSDQHREDYEAMSLGRHWSTRSGMAETAAYTSAVARGGTQIVLEAEYDPSSVDTEPTGTTRIWQKAEDEVTLLPGAPVTVTQVYVKPSPYESWLPMLDSPMTSIAAKTAADDGDDTYVVDAIEALLARWPDEDVPDEDDPLVRLYALLVLANGTETTLEDVHDAWALWEDGEGEPDHESLIPFDELDEETQELDRPYMEAIHQATRDLGLEKAATRNSKQNKGYVTTERSIYATEEDSLSRSDSDRVLRTGAARRPPGARRVVATESGDGEEQYPSNREPGLTEADVALFHAQYAKSGDPYDSGAATLAAEASADSSIDDYEAAALVLLTLLNGDFGDLTAQLAFHMARAHLAYRGHVITTQYGPSLIRLALSGAPVETLARWFSSNTREGKMAASETRTLWRGLNFGEVDEENLQLILSDPATHLKEQMDLYTAAGIHWTDDPSSAYNFAMGYDSEGWAGDNGWFEEDEEPEYNVGVVLEAQVPENGITSEGEENWEDHQDDADMILDYSVEREITVRQGTPITIGRVALVYSRPEEAPQEVTVSLDMQTTAAATAKTIYRGISLPEAPESPEELNVFWDRLGLSWTDNYETGLDFAFGDTWGRTEHYPTLLKASVAEDQILFDHSRLLTHGDMGDLARMYNAEKGWPERNNAWSRNDPNFMEFVEMMEPDKTYDPDAEQTAYGYEQQEITLREGAVLHLESLIIFDPESHQMLREYPLNRSANAADYSPMSLSPSVQQRVRASLLKTAGKGCMVALVPPDEIREELALEGGEPPEQLHVTIAYLGDEGLMDEDRMRGDIEEWAQNQEPLLGAASGCGTFENSDEYVLWAGYDIPGADELRVSLKGILEGEYTEDLDAEHGFQPHMTLSYSDTRFAKLPELPEPTKERHEMRLFLVRNDDWSEIPLGRKVVRGSWT